MVTLTPQQQQALEKLQFFTNDPKGRAFVLRGYAGTGKTTLLGRYASWLNDQQFEPVLLATTGRAAKVLAAKTDLSTQTIHSCVYQFNDMSEVGESGEQLTLQFGVRTPPEDADNQVYIVDEASMIANTATTGGQVAKFGSGHLLLDFLAFTERRKVVFVGDPCQLPPVSADT